MKRRIWLFQLPLVAVFTFAFLVSEWGAQGRLTKGWIQENAFPALRSFSGSLTNLKFKIRGVTHPKNKIEIVAIDDVSVASQGRWPWNRKLMAVLINEIFRYGAKAVALDIVFSEPSDIVPQDLVAELTKIKRDDLVRDFQPDPYLRATIAQNHDKLVLGWVYEYCQPVFKNCPDFNDPEWKKTIPPEMEKFAMKASYPEGAFKPEDTPLVSVLSPLTNIANFNEVADHAGTFGAFPDHDGFIRRVPLVTVMDGKPYPHLALEAVRAALGEELEVSFDHENKVKSIRFTHSGREIPTSPLGVMDMNFRGPTETFGPYISAQAIFDRFGAAPETRAPASEAQPDLSGRLKDAIVFIGATAKGIYDMRAFPFDAQEPGVEGHATIADNILSGDMLRPGSGNAGFLTILLFMTLGAIGLSIAAETLESIPALLLLIGSMGAFGLLDFKYLFPRNFDWNTIYLYTEMAAIFATTIAAKYWIEEQDKKFIRGAFSKYVAPALVDSILEDPKKLSLGGVKKELTILFSDIRGFTTFSERMDAKALAHFLNDYLGLMTDLVFDHQGTLDKYIGDAVMAFWGAPLDQPNHALNACQSAVAMQKKLAENRSRFKSQYGVDVNIGIGINTGSVNVGNMGSERIFEYTVIGDHVNLASRLEGLTKHYAVKIITSRFTIDSIKASNLDPPAYRVLDFVKVKGKKTAVELVEILVDDLSAEHLATYEKARKLYLDRDFASAKTLFALIAERDGLASVYLERIEHFMSNPPAADWDGSWEMDSK